MAKEKVIANQEELDETASSLDEMTDELYGPTEAEEAFETGLANAPLETDEDLDADSDDKDDLDEEQPGAGEQETAEGDETPPEDEHDELLDTDEDAGEPSGAVPLSTHIREKQKLKARIRERDAQLARLQGDTSRGSVSGPAPAQDPLDVWEAKYKADNDGRSPDEDQVSPPYSVIKAHDNWRDNQQAQMGEANEINRLNRLLAVGAPAVDKRLPEGVDLQTVMEMAVPYMDDLDRQLLQRELRKHVDGESAAVAAFKFAKRIILDAGGDDAALLKAALAPAKTKGKPAGGQTPAGNKQRQQGGGQQAPGRLDLRSSRSNVRDLTDMMFHPDKYYGI